MKNLCALKCSLIFLSIFILFLLKIEFFDKKIPVNNSNEIFKVENSEFLIKEADYTIPSSIDIRVKTITHSGRTYDVFYNYPYEPFFVIKVN